MILEFKRKVKLPRDIEIRIENISFEYVDILSEAMIRLGGLNGTDEQYKEAKDLVVKKFQEALDLALEEYD